MDPINGLESHIRDNNNTNNDNTDQLYTMPILITMYKYIIIFSNHM